MVLSQTMIGFSPSARAVSARSTARSVLIAVTKSFERVWSGDPKPVRRKVVGLRRSPSSGSASAGTTARLLISRIFRSTRCWSWAMSPRIGARMSMNIRLRSARAGSWMVVNSIDERSCSRRTMTPSATSMVEKISWMVSPPRMSISASLSADMPSGSRRWKNDIDLALRPNVAEA